MPFSGGTCAWVGLDFADSVALAGLGLDGLAGGGAAGAVVAGAGAAAAAGAAPTATSGGIFWIVFAGQPAFERSATDPYGRPAMIFFAVAGPTPGRSSSSFSVATLRSTLAAGAGLFLP